MSDVAVRAAAVSSVPRDYTIPGAQELLPKAVSAAMDGTSAGGPWLPCLQVLDPGGNIMLSAVASSSVAAGASADVTWFPRVASKTQAGGGIQFDTDNVGDWLQIETTGLVGGDFSQPYAARHPATEYGQAFNNANGSLFTVPANSFFNSGNPVVDIEDYKSSGDLGAFGQLIQVEDQTAAGTQDVIGQQIISGANGTLNAVGEKVQANMGSSGTADANAGAFLATNQGAGREVAVSGTAGVHQSGVNALCFLGINGVGSEVFKVASDGSVIGTFDGGSA